VPYLAVVTKETDEETGDASFATELYETKLCTDLYTEANSPQLVEQFAPFTSVSDATTYDWFCPDIPDIQV